MTNRLTFVSKSSFLACALGLCASSVSLVTKAKASVYEQFNSCATHAIAAKSLSAKKISVELPTESMEVMDHDQSSARLEYVMALINSRTGEDLGKIRCTLTRDGSVKSVRYLTKS